MGITSTESDVMSRVRLIEYPYGIAGLFCNLLIPNYMQSIGPEDEDDIFLDYSQEDEPEESEPNEPCYE